MQETIVVYCIGYVLVAPLSTLLVCLVYFHFCFWCFALVFLSYTNAYIYIIFNIRSSRHPRLPGKGFESQ